MIEDRDHRFHGQAGLVDDGNRMVVLFKYMRMLMIKLGRGAAGNIQQVARRCDADGRSIGHVHMAFRDGLDFGNIGIGRRGLEGFAALGHCLGSPFNYCAGRVAISVCAR